MTSDPETLLSISTARDGDRAVLVLEGELDPHTAPLLSAELGELAEEGVRHISLDLARVGFIDSSGLRVILTARRVAQDRGEELVITSPSPTARRLLEITGLVDLIGGPEVSG